MQWPEVTRLRHVFKLDPDRIINEADLESVCLSGTDAIMVGGSSDITYDNTVELLSRIRRFEVLCLLEVSNLEAVVPGFDYYMIPIVLNAGDPKWMIGQHAKAVKQYGHIIPWDMLIPEGYIVLNDDSTVAKLTDAQTELDADETAAYATVAEKLLQLPIVYLEYSGKFGNMELVSTVHRGLDGSARLFYGGGIVDAASARTAAAVSDAIIVGNVIYSDLPSALETVHAVKGESYG